MNDDFLHQLRVQPSASFAAKLKVRLDTQSAIAAAKRRAVKWYVLCGLLLGTTAVALIVPSVRIAIVAWFQSGSAQVVGQSALRPTADQAVAGGTKQTTASGSEDLGTTARTDLMLEDEGAPAAKIQSGPSDSPAAAPSSQNSAVNLAIDSRRMVHISVALEAKEPADKIIAAFESAYGHETRRNPTALPACTRWPMPDVFVTLGRMSSYEDAACRRARVNLITTPIAYDAYVAIVNRENTWAQSLTIDDLRALAQPRTFPNPLATWDQIRAEWPSLPINVVGLASTMGTQGASFVSVRSGSPLPFVIDKDDADVVKEIDASYGGLGFIRFATYMKQLEEGHGSLPVKALSVVSESDEPMLPSKESVESGRYDTLSRALLLHINSQSLQRIQVLDFGTHTIEAMPPQLTSLGYAGIDKQTMDSAARKVRASSSRPR